MDDELYKKHRPKTFKAVVGNADVVRMLTSLLKKGKLPRALLFTGPSGCGKTTFARILKTKLECGNTDFQELNCAEVRGIDTIRSIAMQMTLSPVGGKCRIWLIDEAHKLTNDAQNSLLKMLEDTPRHVHFMLATTDPGKLIKAIHTRVTEMRCASLLPKEMELLLKRVAGIEKIELTGDVLDRLIEVADGSPRKGLVLVHQISNFEDEQDRLDCILSSDSKKAAIEIARALLNPRTRWPDISKILKCVDEEPESLRHMVMSYATSTMLNNKLVDRCATIIDCFENNFFDSKKAGLALACYKVITTK